MFAMPGTRAFAISADQNAGTISCNSQGIYVGHVPLLKRLDGWWVPRPTFVLNEELTACYQLPIDIAAKASALSLIAHAFNRGDLAMAAIASVQMQFPNPPQLVKGAEQIEELTRRASELRRSGLLKVWEPEKHPRAGEPPNAGWFAPVSHSHDPGVQVAVRPDPHNPWKISPDSEGGGGGAGPGEAPSQSGGSQTQLPFPGGLPPQLAPFVGGKTSGIFQSPNRPPLELQSGYQGPANAMRGSDGFDGLTLSHVEGHAAALMREQGLTEGTLLINNPKICDSCMRLLPKMLPSGATLNVVLPDKTVIQFKGISR